MSADAPEGEMRGRQLELVSTLPGRIRMRVSWLRRLPDLAQRLSAELSALPGMQRVELRPFTGSVLCLFAPPTSEADILALLHRETRCAELRRPGDPPPPPLPPDGPSPIARAVAEIFREVNLRVRAATEGRLDMGTLAALCFFALGSMQVARSERLPIPAWFNLGWWSFRTFMTTEAEVIRTVANGDARGNGAGESEHDGD